ncbi:hypothetical protein BGW39_005627 [Mortierella sp. 14UC]|nr:hypothetical protein BGW39_005627 [Mortierella sp. 14UC]
MSIASLSSTTTANTTKKSRRFSLVRLFSNSSNSSNNSTSSGLSSSSSSSTLNDNSSSPYLRRSMEPSCSMDTMQTDIMRERRKSIAALTGSPRCSMSLDFRPSSSSSGRRPILGGRNKESAPQPAEMTEKMRQFDEMLYTRKTSTIRISLTPTLLQEPL